MAGIYRRPLKNVIDGSRHLCQPSPRATHRVYGSTIFTLPKSQLSMFQVSFSRDYCVSTKLAYERVNLVSPNYEVCSPYFDMDIPNMSLTDFCFQKMGENSSDFGMMNMETGERYTWGDIKDSARRVASALTKLGYRKGDVICIFKTNSPEFTIMFLAVSSIGATLTTANPQYNAGELKAQLEDSGANAIFVKPSLGDIAKAASKGNPQIKEIISVGECENCVKFDSLLNDDCTAFPDDVQINADEDILIIPYSSGTTALPKGVMLTHRNVIANILQLGRQSPTVAGDRSVAVLPFYHIYGLVVIQLSAINDNFSVHTMSGFERTKFLEYLQDEKITFIHAVPPIIILLTKHPDVENYDLSNLRLIISAAAPLSADVTREFLQRFPDKVLLQGYGMTELSPVTNCDIPPGVPGSIGPLLVNTKAKVVDVESGRNLGPGEEGEVCMQGPQMMKGYLNNQAATDNIIRDGWLHTGDIGKYNEHGHFTITDRLKELIKYKGFQVPPAELESVLLTHPDIQDVGVIGVPDDYAGELPRAFVVLKADKTTTEKEIVDYVASHLVHIKHLRGGVVFVKEIPKTTSGKILRRKLRDML